jgi:hypothetical protein
MVALLGLSDSARIMYRADVWRQAVCLPHLNYGQILWDAGRIMNCGRVADKMEHREFTTFYKPQWLKDSRLLWGRDLINSVEPSLAEPLTS